jgi:hypothetical protein
VAYGRLVTRTVPAAASSVLTGLMQPGTHARLVEVARTRASVHYETGCDEVPMMCVCTPQAVRLPASVVTSVLPPGGALVRDGVLCDATTRWQVVRWWRPRRPRGLHVPASFAPGSAVSDVVPLDLVGRGPGLTPQGDDVLAAALVAAAAVGHPRLAEWRAGTARALVVRSTTAVSRGLLRHALDGWAVPQLADYLEAVCGGDPDGAAGARASLLRVGHSSGTALAAGADHVLASMVRAGAA